MSTASARPLIDERMRQFIVVLPSWVGDAVMATPVLRAMREALPQAMITGVMRPGLDELLAGTPWLDQTIVTHNTGVLGPLQEARQMRRCRPDAALLLPNSFRSALALRLSRCPVRIGYARDGRSFLLTHAVPPPSRNAPIAAPAYYARLAATALGIADIDRTMQLHSTDEQRTEADRLLQGVPSRFIVLNPGANKSQKRWPPEGFAAVGDALATSHDLSVLVNGAPAESALVEAVIAASTSPDRYINLIQRGIRLGSLKAVIERAALLITNDTGPRHIAAAFGTPIVSLFGPTDHRWTTLPGPVQERRLLAEPFLPEELTADGHPDMCAIERIRASDVIAAAEQLIAQTVHTAEKCSG